VILLQGLIMLVHQGGAPGDTIIPLRPPLVRESDALTLDAEGAPDGAFPAAVIEEMDGIPALALSPTQRKLYIEGLSGLLGAVRTRDGALRRQDAFRGVFTRVTVSVLEELRPAQVRFIVDRHEELAVEFEASYWRKLAEKLKSGRSAGAPSFPVSTRGASGPKSPTHAEPPSLP